MHLADTVKALKEIQNEEIQDLTNLNILEGPTVTHLDHVLKTHKIKVEAYHGRSFVGNHCHIYLSNRFLQDLRDTTLEFVSNISCQSHIHAKAKIIVERFYKLNTLFARVHRDISGIGYIPDDEYMNINTNIDAYLCFYRECFDRIIPKMHFLEDHVMDWVERYQVGMALHGEQGGEGIHCVFNKLKTIHSESHNPLARLTAMMKDHMTRCSPRVQKYTIIPKRKLKNQK